MLTSYTYQIQFTVHYDDGRQLIESRKICAGSTTELNEKFIEVLKNEFPDLSINNLKISQVE